MKIKVISLNMYEGILLDKAVDFLKLENPDILFLQEVYGQNAPESDNQFRTLEILQNTLQLSHSYFIPGLRHRREEGKFLIGNAIFSRYPIIRSTAVFFNAPYNDDFVVDPKYNHMYPHTLQHVVIDTPDGEVNAFNIHGTWDLDGDNYSEQRKQMSQAIIRAVESKPHVILAGDTNAKPTNQAMRRVEQHLTSVFGDSLKTTFNMSRKNNPGYASAAVDMMFVGHDITIVERKCPNVDVSDHLPLVVTLDV
ncbi:MAG: endonuclease [Candidatus Saccharibacteria bacterium]|nr:endonuclease [Candidatus Saccharibacteria bacterium]